MAVTLTPVNRGTVPGDQTGDEPYVAFGKVNTSDSALKAGVDLVLDLPQSTILGRVTAGTGDPEKLTTAQVKTLLDLTGTNSGDQTSLTGISDTKANFDTALSDGSFMFTEVATLNDLAGVINSFTALTDGQVLTYDTVNGWQNETPAAGVTDHTLLSNIGTNTHAQIDTHLGLTNEHIDWTNATASLVTTGAITATSNTITASKFVTGSNGISMSTTTSILAVGSGVASNTGANMWLYGPAHASTPYDIVFSSDSTNELFFDYSANLWDFQANAITTTGQGTFGNIKINQNTAGITRTTEGASDALKIHGGNAANRGAGISLNGPNHILANALYILENGGTVFARIPASGVDFYTDDLRTGGDLIFDVASAGVDFSLSQTTSVTGTVSKEVFTNYEQGSFTPTLNDGTNSATGYSIQSGYYTRIGNQVFIHVFIGISNMGSISGNLFVGGMPFTVGSLSGTAMFRSLSGFTLTAGTAITGAISGTTTPRIALQKFDATTGTSSVTDADVGTNPNFQLSGFYIVNGDT